MVRHAKLALYEVQPVLRKKIRELAERAGYDVLFEGPLNEKTARSDADVWIVKWTYALRAELLDKVRPKKGIVSMTVGTEHIDKEAIARHGLLLDNCPSSPTISVAEHALALSYLALLDECTFPPGHGPMIFSNCGSDVFEAVMGQILIRARNFQNSSVRARKYDFSRSDDSWNNPEVTGSKVAIVGNNPDAMEIARVFSLGFGCELFGFDTVDELVAYGTKQTSFAQILFNSDYVFLFSDKYGNMKPSSISCNDAGSVKTKFRSSKVGILGAGRIGSLIARIASLGFGCDVVAYDINQNMAFRSFGLRYAKDLNEAIADRDFIFICLPLNDQTRLLLNEDILSSVQNDRQVIVNVSRDEIIDSRALLGQLERGKIMGYATDVLPDEKRLIDGLGPSDLAKALLEHPRVFVTPHEGEASDGTVSRATMEAFGKVERMFGDFDSVIKGMI